MILPHHEHINLMLPHREHINLMRSHHEHIILHLDNNFLNNWFISNRQSFLVVNQRFHACRDFRKIHSLSLVPSIHPSMGTLHVSYKICPWYPISSIHSAESQFKNPQSFVRPWLDQSWRCCLKDLQDRESVILNRVVPILPRFLLSFVLAWEISWTVWPWMPCRLLGTKCVSSAWNSWISPEIDYFTGAPLRTWVVYDSTAAFLHNKVKLDKMIEKGTSRRFRWSLEGLDESLEGVWLYPTRWLRSVLWIARPIAESNPGF